MERAELHDFAILENYRPTVSFAVIVRWVLLGAWFFLLHYRIDYDRTWVYLQMLGGGLAILNAYVTWKIVAGKPIRWHYAVTLSVADLAVITTGISLLGGFQNPYYAFYYPALLGLALMSPRQVVVTVGAAAIGLYLLMAFTVSPTLIWDQEQEKVLLVRVLSMVAILAAGTLITGWERSRRQEAVATERQRAKENLELQRKVQEAEQEIQRERIRISHEIHDGAAQSAYVLSLGLETSCKLAGDNLLLRDRLSALHAQSRQALWELRYPINLGPLFEGKRFGQLLADHLDNFRTITSIATAPSIKGEERALPVVIEQKLFSIAHNALTNVYKHAGASAVTVDLAYDEDFLQLSISDDGVGFDTKGLASASGHGVRNMHRTMEELGGTFEISSSPGKGTTVTVNLPLGEA